MLYAFINDNIVKKLEDISEDELQGSLHLYQQIIPVSQFSRTPKVGWIFDNGQVYPDIKPVTPRQIRQAWILSGKLLSEIDNAINMLPEPTRSLAKTEWEYSTMVFRRNKLVGLLAQAQGYTEDELDQLWIFAGSLP